jgi:hypothetical protein
MSDDPKATSPSGAPATGPVARRPVGSPARPLRPADVRETAALRGLVIRSGVGALPAVWED